MDLRSRETSSFRPTLTRPVRVCHLECGRERDRCRFETSARGRPVPARWGFTGYETIDQALFVQGRGRLCTELHRHMRTGRAWRSRTGSPARPKAKILGMVSISDRPAEAADRAVPGHWEGDLILGKNCRSAIGTLVERQTRFCLLVHLPDGHGAEAVRDRLVSAIQTLPQQLRRSLTWDQGTELAQHQAITLAKDMAIYFCHPHSPWQRGSNENTNGLLRQYARHIRAVATPWLAAMSRRSRSRTPTLSSRIRSWPRRGRICASSRRRWASMVTGGSSASPAYQASASAETRLAAVTWPRPTIRARSRKASFSADSAAVLVLPRRSTARTRPS